jgi:hypothetical protein
MISRLSLMMFLIAWIARKTERGNSSIQFPNRSVHEIFALLKLSISYAYNGFKHCKEQKMLRFVLASVTRTIAVTSIGHKASVTGCTGHNRKGIQLPRCKADENQLPEDRYRHGALSIQVQPVLNADHPVAKSVMQLMASTSSVESTT